MHRKVGIARCLFAHDGDDNYLERILPDFADEDALCAIGSCCVRCGMCEAKGNKNPCRGNYIWMYSMRPLRSGRTD